MLHSLMRLPNHKQGTTKFDKSTMNRSIATLTFEDTDQFHNLGFIATLREEKPTARKFETQTSIVVEKGNSEEVSHAGESTFSPTIPNPPSFYEKDLDFQENKYQKVLKERQIFKAKHYKDQNLSIFTSNDNVQKHDLDKKLQEDRYTGGQIQPQTSEIKRVLKRRKSRMSVLSPTTVDFEHVGNTSEFQHIIANRSQSKEQIQFNMNLRKYKNSTKFESNEAWQYPKVKNFSPKFQLKDIRESVKEKNGLSKFLPGVSEANANEILHLQPANSAVTNY